MYIVTPKDDEHWLGMRAKNVNSTESSALFGLSPYSTELEIFYRKKTGEITTLEDNDRMKAGRFLEPAIAQFAADKLGCEVQPMKDYIYDDSRMGGSFDFEITSGEHKDWILEIKNVDYLVYKNKWEDDEAPDHIEVQVQHQLEITKRPGAIITVLVGGNDLKMIKRERNPKMGAGIRKRIEKFWRDVESNNPPEPNYNTDAEFIIALNQYSEENVYDATEDSKINELLKEYKEAMTEASEADKRKKAKKAEVFDMIGACNKVISQGYKLNCSMTKTSAAETLIITPEMVGDEIIMKKGRSSYRQFRVSEINQGE